MLKAGAKTNKTMITEDYVSFEVAKLLKEKGFDSECDYFYVNGNIVRAQGYGCNWNKGETIFTDYKNECSAPTLQMAIKWLREVHDLHIISYPWKADKEERAIHWCCQVYKSFNLLGYEKYTNETVKSYEEACEAAIKYCLENLI